ncbi:hypothetical protein HY636_01575 [Candidatus Woesearchaeota archaeon]|nr:hypothetical protein [Candidatus Woesearchaeota archaeon]
MIAGSEGGSPANLQDLIQSAILQFTNGFPQEPAEQQKADSTLRELVDNFEGITALPHAEKFPVFKLIASYCEPHGAQYSDGVQMVRTRERAYNLIYTTDENNVPFAEKKAFLEQRVMSHTTNQSLTSSEIRNIVTEQRRFVRNLRYIGGLRSTSEAVKYIEANYKLFKPALEAEGLLKTHSLWPDTGDYVKLREEAKRYDMLNPTSRETKAKDSFFHGDIVPRSLILATVGVAAVVVGTYLYATVFNATNDSDSQTPQKDEQTVEAQPSPAHYFHQYQQSASFPTKYVIGKGQEKTFGALSQQCISGFTQYLEANGVSAEGLDVKSPCNHLIYDAIKRYGCNVDGNDYLLEPNGKQVSKKRQITIDSRF